jgi:C-terminal processing protease CtpA/Prc
MIKYTAAKWYSPNGNNIDGKGITPGIYVEQNISFILKGEEAVDAQLDRAREFLVNNK